MTQADYDIFFRIVEFCMVLVQSAFLLMLWKAVFRTKREMSAVLAAALFFAVRHMVKERKSGGCGCGCADCPSRGMCHRIEEALKDTK